MPLSEYYLPPETLEDPNVEVRGDMIYIHLDTSMDEQWVQEREELVAILERHGVEVLRPRKLFFYLCALYGKTADSPESRRQHLIHFPDPFASFSLSSARISGPYFWIIRARKSVVLNPFI